VLVCEQHYRCMTKTAATLSTDNDDIIQILTGAEVHTEKLCPEVV